MGSLGLADLWPRRSGILLAAGATVFLADDHKTPEQLPDGAHLRPWSDWPWTEIDLMVISPGSRTHTQHHTSGGHAGRQT